MPFYYQIFIFLLGAIYKLASVFHPKAKKWVSGRKIQNLKKIEQPSSIWFHCASLGEFEQARPLIESLKKRYSDPIVLTFFSSSGFEIQKKYQFADHVYYLPLDTHKNASFFLDQVNPKLAIFTKYDLWYNYLHECSQRAIPVMLISAIFTPSQYFFQWYGSAFLAKLKNLETIFVQDQTSLSVLRRNGVIQCQQAGDTRIDRVVNISQQPWSNDLLEKFKGGLPLFIAGSTWSKDEELLEELIRKMCNSGWKVIIAPHDIGLARIEEIETRFTKLKVNILSTYTGDSHLQVLIIDSIGLLSKIYRLGKIAYIGGGFSAGIHNTLEPMAFGLPVIIGPKYHKFREAVEMVEQKGMFSVKDQQELNSIWDSLTQSNLYEHSKQEIINYLAKNQGATKKILQFIESKKWLVK